MKNIILKCSFGGSAPGDIVEVEDRVAKTLVEEKNAAYVEEKVPQSSQQVETLTEQNETLVGQVETLTEQNETLVGQVETLTEQNETLVGQVEEAISLPKGQTPNGYVKV